MEKIKIISNPYNMEMLYQSYKEQSDEWEDIKISNTDSKLREDETGRAFLPFKIKKIIDIIVDEYYVNSEMIELVFEGTRDEYLEVEAVCKKEEIRNKVNLTRSPKILENARMIFEPTKNIFSTVQPIIEEIIKDDENVQKNLNKVSDALKDIIPICVFGNYSAGKSTFINALIGSEILPSGGDPVTAKVYKIERSKNEDAAKIKFSYRNQAFEILFEGNSYRLLKGNSENELICNITEAFLEASNETMSTYINIALKLINGYEKSDKDNVVISNVIELEVPFLKSGELGRSHNNFVIFDTPGSNSESNIEHTKVLEEALEGFSNGIPVWISTYDSIDSTDNASLCKKISDIKALDKRFTMIVLNKADTSDLGEGEFSRGKEQEILEYSSVEKMYAGGIYFVSSIMGLGAKNNGVLLDKHYRKTYRSQQEMYSDPEDEDYAVLYKYNIMPEQIKEKMIGYSMHCPNIIYANSGLYCIEKEMENFASKYAAYNKCQMVYMFLKDVIEETEKRIISKTESLKRTREARKRELESTKAQLIDNLNNTAQESEYEYDKESQRFIKSDIISNMNYLYSVEELEKRTEELRMENIEESNFSNQQQGYENSKNNMFSNLKSNSQNLFKGGFLNSLKTIKEDLARDYSIMRENKENMDNADRKIDKETSDELLQMVVGEYKRNILEAEEILSAAIREHWRANAQNLRKILIEIITGSDALSSIQREELSDIIMSYQILDFKDDADSVFIKSKFLRGNVLGIKISDSEKLNIKRLTGSYNDKIKKTIDEMAEKMNDNCHMSFRRWKGNLAAVIEENITEYNPQLRDMSDMIKEETEKIAELEDSQNTIRTSLNEIEELMSWKMVEI